MREYIILESEVETLEKEFCIELAPVREDRLIRCKDCKHRDEENANCTRFRKDWYVQSNSFCSWAEPKEEKR